MKKYLLVSSGIMTLLVLLFFVAEILHLPFLTDSRFTQVAGQQMWWIGMLLLVIDVLVPVPSSLVMITLGSSFGILWGSLFSFCGVMGAAILGFALGRFSKPAIRFLLSESDQKKTNSFIDQWGIVAIIITRPMPLLAETTVLMAGTTGLSWKKLVLASVIGNVPIAILYAWTGAAARSINGGLWSFLLAMGIAGIFWLANYIFSAAQKRAGSAGVPPASN